MAEILIVDDDRATGERIGALLTADGHRVHWVGSARDGLSSHGKNSFDLIVTEVYLPGMNGLELISILRGRGDGVPILALSVGYQRMSERVSLLLARCHGAFAALEKPVFLEELRRTVQEGLANHCSNTVATSDRLVRDGGERGVSRWHV